MLSGLPPGIVDEVGIYICVCVCEYIYITEARESTRVLIMARLEEKDGTIEDEFYDRYIRARIISFKGSHNFDS